MGEASHRLRAGAALLLPAASAAHSRSRGVALLHPLRPGHGIWYGPAFDPESAALFPKDYGYGLLAVYAVWLLVILILYPLCRWFAELKQRRRDPWLSYL